MVEGAAGGAPLVLHPRAKLNIVLRVLSRQQDGYHALETLFLRLDLADRLALWGGGRGIRLEVTGDPSVPADATNLCWRAAELVFRAVGQPPAVAISLDKVIPSGAGLGGGSADAAAVLHGLNALLGEPLAFHDLLVLAGELGSDVPFALADVDFALAWERGRRLLPLAAPPPRPVLILAPGLPIGAGEAYGWLAADRAAGSETVQEQAGILPGPGSLATWEDLQRVAGNDFEGPVFRRHPELRAARDALRAAGANPALLCGSGSCLAGVFETQVAPREIAERLAEATGMRAIPTSAAGRG